MSYKSEFNKLGRAERAIWLCCFQDFCEHLPRHLAYCYELEKTSVVDVICYQFLGCHYSIMMYLLLLVVLLTAGTVFSDF